MFRKLISVAAATAAMTSFLGTVATPAAHADTTAVRVFIGYDTVPRANGAFTTGGEDLVASITGTIEGVQIDASSCAVESPGLPALAAGSGGSALIAHCSGTDAVLSLTPFVDAGGNLGATGNGAAAAGKWTFKAGCHAVYYWGIFAGIECEFSVTYTS